MTRIINLTLFAALLFICSSFTLNSVETPIAKEVKWYTFEEAVELSKKNPKKMMIDIYTPWCGWCKKMDKTSFVDPKVAAYLSKHFYAVKLDAEMKEEVLFNGHKFEFMSDAGKRGVHTLAYSLLEGKMSYPSIVYMDEKMHRILISPGYKDGKDLLKELKFTGEEQYNVMKWEEYRKKP